MIVVYMTLMKSSTVKPFLVLCGHSDLARNLKMLVGFSKLKRLKKSFGETRNKQGLTGCQIYSIRCTI